MVPTGSRRSPNFQSRSIPNLSGTGTDDLLWPVKQWQAREEQQGQGCRMVKSLQSSHATEGSRAGNSRKRNIDLGQATNQHEI